MNELMKAIVLAGDVLTVHNVPKPQQAEPGHLIIKMNSSAINSGDKFFLRHEPPPGMVKSLHGVKGVSGAGAVLQSGDGVPEAYQGRNVAFYRNLYYSESVVGAWSEYVHVHYLDCVLLPESAEPEEYSGSVVNVITPYSFLKQISGEGHKGIVSTAGNSATGIAMVGLCREYNFPLLSIVRTEEGRKELEALGAKNIVVQSEDDFDRQLAEQTKAMAATAIFDGVGGAILSRILPLMSYGSVIYSYGYIGDAVPLTFNTSMLAVKNISIKPFANLKTETVMNATLLEKALQDIGALIHLPDYKTKIGKRFKPEEINEAVDFATKGGGKAVLVF